MAFLTDAQVLLKVSDILQQVSPSNLPAQWATTMVPDAHTWAYNEIVTALTARGFSAAQIAAWDRGAEFEAELTIYRAFLRAGTLLNADDRFLKSFDRRDELYGRNNVQGVSVLNSGVWQPPANTTGQISTGSQDTNRDIFVWPDEQDTSLGQVSNW